MTVDTAALCPACAVLRPFPIFLSDRNFIAEELCRIASRMRDERLFLRQFEFEFFAQERSELLFDLFGFCFWSRKTQYKVIGVPTKSEAPVVGVLEIVRRKLLGLSSHPLGSLLLPLFEQALRLVKQVGVVLVRFSSLPPGVLWDENGFDKGIELVEQDIGKNRADN